MEYIGHLHWFRGDMINWMWKRGKPILGCPSSCWNFLQAKKIPCGNVEYIGYLDWFRGDMINWMWKWGKSIQDVHVHPPVRNF